MWLVNVGVPRRVEQGVGLFVVARGEGDLLGFGEVRRVDVEVARSFEDRGFLARPPADDTRRLGRTCGHEHYCLAVGLDVRPREVCVGEIDGFERALRVEQPQVVVAAAPEPDGDAAVVENGVRRQAEHPLRDAELRLGWVERHWLAVVDPVGVPPARAIGDGVESASRTPCGLEDGFAAAAQHLPFVVEPAVVRDGRDVERRFVPRHCRVVPRCPRELGPIGIHPGERVEIVALGHHARLAGTVGRERDERVRRLVAVGVALADAVETLAVGRDRQIGVAVAALDIGSRRDRLGILPGALTVEALVLEVREPGRAVIHEEVTAAVLVNERPDVVARRCDVHRFVASLADEDPSPLLVGASFEPPCRALIAGDAGEVDAAAGNHLGCDR